MHRRAGFSWVMQTARGASAPPRPRVPASDPHRAGSPTDTLPALRGTTSVTTAPGIVTALVGKGVLPLPVAPKTGFALGLSRGAPVATYRFPIYRGNPDLSGPSGDILHPGGIYFLGAGGKHLSIRTFDIDLAAGKVFANRVNGAKAHVAILDLDLSGLSVIKKNGATVLSGIKVTLDAQAATALNATFSGLNLPSGLAFGSAQVVVKG
jgi:hypothetical protein